ncbi:Prefoldin beta-like protein [Pseudovirgaria hyperparasitica]|uniref:Prefoldin beta-like protein n=1 Tax=Pseudovirgaria hyperparasitica TaxID=470096 RepID=A0A6A6WDU6_9PEZI|nr:Prefoldin beta-like protein [Pseudovirgaria hyperparasitica]KAF2760883.1 Prefoldin beta-like protein [Pseudovirgaria hyperparasitica]
MGDQKKLQELSDEFQKFQAELQSIVDGRQKLESQQQENDSVKKEFTKNPNATKFKLIGPVLLKQDQTEAQMSVDGRLDFIEKEIKRVEGQIKDIQTKSEQKKMEIIQLQSSIQQQSQGQAQAAQA